MTHAPQTSSIRQLYCSRIGFSYVCHANLAPDSSCTRFCHWLCHHSIPSQKVVCTMHMT